MELHEISARLGSTIGIAKARQAVEQASSELGLAGTSLTPNQCEQVLGRLVAAGGIIGIAAQVLQAQLTLVTRPTTPYASSPGGSGSAGRVGSLSSGELSRTAPTANPSSSEALFSVVVEAKGALLHMTLRGLWTTEVARDYQQQVRSLWDRCAPAFHALVDVRRSPIQVPEVAKLRSELIQEAVARGLVGVAYITENALAKMQMRRLALEGGCKEVECFGDDDQASGWLHRRFQVERGG